MSARRLVYTNVRSWMYKQRIKMWPKMPKTFQDFVDSVQSAAPFADLVKAVIKTKNGKHIVILSSDILLRAINSAKQIYMDGTFSVSFYQFIAVTKNIKFGCIFLLLQVVPRVPSFHQLYTIHFRKHGTVSLFLLFMFITFSSLKLKSSTCLIFIYRLLELFSY